MSKRPQKRQRRAILDEREQLLKLRQGAHDLTRYVERTAFDSASRHRFAEVLDGLHAMLCVDLEHNETALKALEEEMRAAGINARYYGDRAWGRDGLDIETDERSQALADSQTTGGEP